MKVVFLDFDGVLNSNAFFGSFPPGERASAGRHLDRAAVARVNRLVRDAGADVVVSSNWRIKRDRKQLQAVLDEYGFEGRVVGRTPRWVRMTPGGIAVSSSRADEIQTWLDNASDYGIDVESFLIVDDEPTMAHFADRHVKTSLDAGLLDEHVERAVAMLRAPMPVLILP